MAERMATVFVPDEESARLIEAWTAAASADLAAGVFPGWDPAGETLGLVLPGGAGLCLAPVPATEVGRPIAARSGGTLDGARHLTWADAARLGLAGAGRGGPSLVGTASGGVVTVALGGVAAHIVEAAAPDPRAIAAGLWARSFAHWWASRPAAAAAGAAGEAGESAPATGDEPPGRAALAAVEGRALLAALEGPFAATGAHPPAGRRADAAGTCGSVEARAAQVALVRRERRAEMGEGAVAAERQREAADGVPAYVGGRCAARLGPADPSGPSVPAALAERLADLAAQSPGRRAAYCGWALCELLDRLQAAAPPAAEPARERPWAFRPRYAEGWKAALASGRAPHLDALLEAHVRFDGGSRDDAALAAALAAFGHAEALREAQRRAGEAAAARQALFDRILRGEGTLVVFDVRKLGAGTVVAPAPAQALHAGMSIYPQGATFAYPSGARLRFERLPLAEDRRSGLLQARVRARLAFRGDGGALRPDAEAVFDEGLDLRLPGLRVRAQSGSIRSIDGGYLIRVLR